MIKRILLALALAFASIAPSVPVPAAPVANINLANAITAFTRTSASGVTPMTWSISFAANVHEGDTLHVRVYSDSALTTLMQDVVHTLTNGDLQPGATIDLTSDGLTAIGATQWLQMTVETTSPLGLYYGYTYATALSPTDAVTAMTLSPTDKDANVTLSGGNLTASGGGGGRGYGVRGSRAVGYDLTYWEVAVTSSGGANVIGVADSSASLSVEWSSAGAVTTHAGAWVSNEGISYNGTVANSTNYTNADTIDVALNRTTKKAWFRKNNGSWLPSGDPVAGTGGLSMASISTPLYPGQQFGFGGQVTYNFGTTPGGTAGFTRTPPTGFVAP